MTDDKKNSLLQEYLDNAKNSPRVMAHIEHHLFFGPIYRDSTMGQIYFYLIRLFLGRGLTQYDQKEQIIYLFFVTKSMIGGLALLMVFVSPFLFLMKAPDALADLLLGLSWLPGLEFIHNLTPFQKYITLARLLLTIPWVYMGINSGNWGW